MDTYRHIILQEENERRYSRELIDGYIRQFIDSNAVMQTKISHGVQLLEKYKSGQYYASKMARISQLSGLDLRQLVTDIFIGISYYLREELYTAVTAQIAGRLRFSDKTEAITTIAEIIAVLCNTDAFDIYKADKMASLVLISRIPLDEKLVRFIEESQYLPPMVCEPVELENNFSGGYLLHKDSLILGSGNHHEGDLCLDVLNTINKVPLRLDPEFLSQVEEEPTFDLNTPEKREQWFNFKKQSYGFYKLMMEQGNEFYLTNKVDKRGRIYAQGYHITTQGTSFKKASIEFSKEELVTGVPV